MQSPMLGGVAELPPIQRGWPKVTRLAVSSFCWSDKLSCRVMEARPGCSGLLWRKALASWYFCLYNSARDQGIFWGSTWKRKLRGRGVWLLPGQQTRAEPDYSYHTHTRRHTHTHTLTHLEHVYTERAKRVFLTWPMSCSYMISRHVIH